MGDLYDVGGLQQTRREPMRRHYENLRESHGRLMEVPWVVYVRRTHGRPTGVPCANTAMIPRDAHGSPMESH